MLELTQAKADECPYDETTWHGDEQNWGPTCWEGKQVLEQYERQTKHCADDHTTADEQEEETFKVETWGHRT